MANGKRVKMGLMAMMLLTTSFILTGCWSATEVDNLAIINVLGIDTDAKGNYQLTVNVIKPQELYRNSANGGGNDVSYQPDIETGKGKSLVEALSMLSERVSNRIYLGHVLVVVLGERVAHDHLQEAMDFLTRENHFRPNIRLLVTNQDAASILRVKPRLESTLGAELNSFLANTAYHATDMVLDTSKFMEKAMSPASDPYTGMISLENVQQQKGKGANKLTKDMGEENDTQKLVFSGTAVFKKNGLMGFLDNRETQGFLWVQGKVSNDIVVLKCQDGEQGTISLKIANTQSRIIPRMENGKPVIDDTIKVNSDIRQLTCKDTHLTTKQLDDINNQLRKKVLSDIHSAFQKAKQDWQADIFGFGDAIYKKYPDEWKTLAPNWTQGELRHLKVNLHVDTNIANYGLVRETE